MSLVLAPIDAAGRQLDVGAALSLARMARRRGAPITVASAYRDPAEQARWRRLWEAGRWPAFVARPEDSDHCRGLAVDVDDDRDPGVWLWLALHADEHGWRRTDPTERWHWVYFAELDQHRTDDQGDDDMPTAQEIATAVWQTPVHDNPDGSKVLAWQALRASYVAATSTLPAVARALDRATEGAVGNDAREARRMLAVVLRAQAPAPGERPPA